METRVTVWNEYVHEQTNAEVAAIYPEGIHAAIADGLRSSSGGELRVKCATLDQKENGLDAATLANTDVLFWWGHAAHDQVSDAVVERVHRRVLEGMGLVVLHSGHHSKIFRRLMGTGCSLRWREAGERERLWITAPGHPILTGIDSSFFDIPEAEMYGEYFDIPAPDELLLISWFEGGEVFRSGCTFRRGKGKIFYFRPGHETYPIYYDANVRRILGNAAHWARPADGTYSYEAIHVPHPEPR